MYKTAIELARETGDAVAECRALTALATYMILPGQGDVQHTLGALRQAAMRTNDPAALWDCELLCSELETLNGNFPAAILRTSRLWSEIQKYPREATPIYSKLQQRINARVHLGALLCLTGKPAEGVQLTEEAAAEALAHPHGLTLIVSLAHGIIWTMIETHHLDRAQFYTGHLRSAIYRHGMAAWIPIADCYSEVIAAYSGASTQPQGLRRAFEGLRQGMTQLGHHAYYATLAKAMIAIGQPEDAARVVEHVLGPHPQRWVLAELLRLRAASERMLGRDGDAEALLRESLKSARETGALAWQLRTAYDLAALLKDRGAQADAIQVLAPIFRKFDDGSDTVDLINARRLLTQLGEADWLDGP